MPDSVSRLAPNVRAYRELWKHGSRTFNDDSIYFFDKARNAYTLLNFHVLRLG